MALIVEFLVSMMFLRLLLTVLAAGCAIIIMLAIV